MQGVWQTGAGVSPSHKQDRATRRPVAVPSVRRGDEDRSRDPEQLQRWCHEDHIAPEHRIQAAIEEAPGRQEKSLARHQSERPKTRHRSKEIDEEITRQKSDEEEDLGTA